MQAALPVDVVILGLHGAMLAEQTLDPEGELIQAVRHLAGPKARVGVTFDPHSHLSLRRVAHADVITVFKEFPHTDFVETAETCVALTLAAARGQIRPVMSVRDAGLIDVFPTSLDPMRSFVDGLREIETRGEALSVSVIHGFMAGDSPDLGAKILVITDDQPQAGAALAHRLAGDLYAFRGKARPEFLTPDEALSQAAADPRGPGVLADVWDNPGGGTAGDSTILLAEILERGLTRVAFGTIWDPMAVRICFAAGAGAELDLRFGGKTSAHAGRPIDAKVRVLHLQRDAVQSFGTSVVPLGDCAVIAVGGIQVVLNTNRAQTFSPDLFTNRGISLQDKALVVAKSTNHFHHAFAPIAARILYAAVDGPYPNDPARTPYRHFKGGIWPMTETPTAWKVSP